MAGVTTKHQKNLGRREKTIVRRLKAADTVRDIGTERIVGPGSHPERLELQAHSRSGLREVAVEAWLCLGSGRRRLTIFPQEGVSMNQMQVALTEALAKQGVEVRVSQDSYVVPKKEQPMQQHETNGVSNGQAVSAAQDVLSIPTNDDLEAVCALIAETWKINTDLEPQEAELVVKLKDVRDKRQQVRSDSVSVILDLLAKRQGD